MPSTKDQIRSAELHGGALLTAKRPELKPLIDHLGDVAQGRDDIRVECAGTIAGSWFADTARRGEDLIAAGLLMLMGLLDSTSWIDGCGLVGSGGAGHMFRTAQLANDSTSRAGRASRTLRRLPWSARLATIRG